MRQPQHFVDDSVASIQWFVFLLANALTLPVVIGQVYQLSAEEVASLLQRTFFVVGLTSFLQGWLGHRLPLADGPAGIWLSVFVIMGEMAAQLGTDLSATLRLLEGGVLLAGFILILISVTGWMKKMLKVFTPLVTGSYLMLLAVQLSGVFLKGMMGISGRESQVDWLTTGVAFAIFLLVLALSIWGKGWLKSYAVLIGILVGWFLFSWIGWSVQKVPGSLTLTYPEIFSWGLPRLDAGMIASATLVALVLISNQVASIAAMNQALQGKSEVNVQCLRRTGMVGGFSNLFSALFSTVGMIPLSITAGFVQMTDKKRMFPFLAACLILMLVSCVPLFTSFLSQLPGPVAYAALLASFGHMFGLGLNSVLQQPLDQRRLTILGVTVSVGMGIMFLSPAVFVGLPSILQDVLGNGLLVGMMISLLMEQLWKPGSYTKKESSHEQKSV